MPIKLEILADNVPALMAQLEDLVAGRQPMPSPFEQEAMPTVVMAPSDAVAMAPLGTQAKAAKPPAKAKTTAKKGNGKTKKVKPLPEDPLAASSDDDEAEDGADGETEEEDPFAESPQAIGAMSEAEMVKAATGKLRDIFSNPAHSGKVRAIKEKYQVNFFHEVPAEKAKAFYDDTLKLEAELVPS